jgi:hypothetical protein
MWQNLFRRLLGIRPVPRSRRRPSPIRPTLEGLEERSLLSAYHVTFNGDSGPGSLRDAVAAANMHPGADKIR